MLANSCTSTRKYRDISQRHPSSGEAVKTSVFARLPIIEASLFSSNYSDKS